jgi:pyruvate kinase
MINKKTKIIATIGPSIYDQNMLVELIKNGVNAFRINLSHGNKEIHERAIYLVKKATEEINKIKEWSNVRPSIIFDTRGPELRTGEFSNDKEKNQLIEGDQVTIITDQEVIGTATLFSVKLKSLTKKLKINDLILIDDGKLRLIVESLTNNKIICKALNNHILSSRRKVNLPDINLDLPFISDKDSKDLLLACQKKVDYIAASFVRDQNDIKEIRNFLDKNDGKNIKIISKIESKSAINNLLNVVKNSDLIMIARGDLSVELPFYKLPVLQEKIVKTCQKENKEVIIATQMLERMIDYLQPTNAEITDVYFAVKLKSNWVMLSGETAAGKYPLETVKAMTKIILYAEENLPNIQ